MAFQNSDSSSRVSGVPETTPAFSFPLGKGNKIFTHLIWLSEENPTC